MEIPIRVIVPREVRLVPENAIWHLLSGDPDRVAYGMQHYRTADVTMYNILNDLKRYYQLEGIEVAYTLEDYQREKKQEMLESLTAEERQEYFQQLTAEERQRFLQQLTAEERQEFVQQASAEDRLRGLSVEEIESYLEELRQQRHKKAKRRNDGSARGPRQ